MNEVGGNMTEAEEEKPGTGGTVGENPGGYSNNDALRAFLQVIPTGGSPPFQDY